LSRLPNISSAVFSSVIRKLTGPLRADVGEGFPCAPADSYSERDLPYLPEIQAHDPLVEFQRNGLALEEDVHADY
jgi:hypothetical protein